MMENDQASHLSEADARTAYREAQFRIRELETQVVSYRSSYAKARRSARAWKRGAISNKQKERQARAECEIADRVERKSKEWLDERREICDILSADPATVAGQTLVEALKAVIAELASLTALVGTETPIAALSLAETWKAEKWHYMEQIEELTQALDEQARVSSHNTQAGNSADEETQEALESALAALQDTRLYVDRLTIQVGPVAHDDLWKARALLLRIDAVLAANAMYHAHASLPGERGGREGTT